MVRTSKAKQAKPNDAGMIASKATATIGTEHQASHTSGDSDNAASSAESPSLIKTLKKAAKTAAKKSRRAQRALLAAPDDPALVAAAKTAADAAAKAVAALDTCRGGAGALPKSQTKGQTFSCVDAASGVDLAQGLTLHRDAISAEMEAELVAWVLKECERGRSGELRKPTYLRAEGSRSQGNRREAIMCVCPPLPTSLRFIKCGVINGWMHTSTDLCVCVICVGSFHSTFFFVLNARLC